MSKIKAYAALSPKERLVPYEYEVKDLESEEIEVKVHYCGICHSDLSMIDNAWNLSVYPLVPGHEIIGTVIGKGKDVKGFEIGQFVGIGWNCQSCMNCKTCLKGDHNLCSKVQGVIVNHHGGFADKVRSHYQWALALPSSLDIKKIAPLLCGGITVFNPLLQYDILPTSKVGVVGIGGLGHMAIKFLKAWGCHITAFTSHDLKKEEILKLGAHRVVNTHQEDLLKDLASSLDFIIVTSNVSLNWPLFIGALGPKGRLHFVGAVLENVAVSPVQLIELQRQISGSPVGSIASMMTMLEFAALHTIEPIVEEFPMSQVNEALAKLRKGDVRYRIVLKNDF
jgi:uncharacterized zinc-type alcohol dehydrogenase-like protein